MTDFWITVKVLGAVLIGMAVVVVMEKLGVPHPGISLICGAGLSLILAGRVL